MLKRYLDLCRVSNLPTAWTNVLAAQVLATGKFDGEYFLVLSLAFSCFYCAGMCLNDLWDAEYDRHARPGRPIPSGKVTPREAGGATILLFAAALALLLLAPYKKEALIVGALLTAVIVAYDRYHKKYPLTLLLMPTSRLLVFVGTALAAAGTTGKGAVVAGSIQFLYVGTISLTARHESRRGQPFPLPAVPLMIAAIALLDGIMLAGAVSPAWLGAGIGGMIMTMAGQRYVRGD
jgi:4-hydroxybenzoate polyprenyltransferase